jgi:hypothetical protein
MSTPRAAEMDWNPRDEQITHNNVIKAQHSFENTALSPVHVSRTCARDEPSPPL